MSKVSEINEITYPLQADDTIYIIRNGQSYKGNLGDLFRGFRKFVPGFEGYIIIPANGNVDPSIIEAGDILIGKGDYQDNNYVMMVALQNNPTQDNHFEVGLNNEVL